MDINEAKGSLPLLANQWLAQAKAKLTNPEGVDVEGALTDIGKAQQIMSRLRALNSQP